MELGVCTLCVRITVTVFVLAQKWYPGRSDHVEGLQRAEEVESWTQWQPGMLGEWEGLTPWARETWALWSA